RAADLGIALFETPFVCDGCLLDKFDVRDSTPPFVTVQERFVRVAGNELTERIGKLHRIVNAAVQSQTADGVVDMCSITREKYPSGAKLRSNPLMGLVEIAMDEIIGSCFWKSALKPVVNGFIAQRMLVGFIDLSGKADAPSSFSIISRNFE